MGKERKYIYFLILVCFLIIYVILRFFFLFAWCLGAEKMWESKEKLAFFFFWSLICLVLRNWKQPKTDRTEPIEVHSVRCRCSSLSVRCRCQIWETENFGSVEKSHFKPTEPNRLHPLLVV